MPEQVQRFSYAGDWRFPPLMPDPDGLLVLYSDYEKLEDVAVLEELRADKSLRRCLRAESERDQARKERDARLKVPAQGNFTDEEVEALAAAYAEWSSDKPFSERHEKHQEFWRKVARFLLTAQADGFLRDQARKQALEEVAEEFAERGTRAFVAREPPRQPELVWDEVAAYCREQADA